MVADHVRISSLWESFLHFHTSKSQQMPCRHDGTIYHGNFSLSQTQFWVPILNEIFDK